jgi:hypothetical protein
MVIEVKEILNYEALGQIMVYRYPFPKVWGFPIVDSAILCKNLLRRWRKCVKLIMFLCSGYEQPSAVKNNFVQTMTYP